MPDEDGPDCGLCGDGLTPAAPLTGPHPLLLDQLTQGGDGTPRTPRGPMPPWAVSADEAPIDLTATGPTPPRSPTPPRATPPGLPDEEASARDQLTGSALSASFDQVFMQDLFKHCRSGNTNALNSMLHQVNGGAFTLVCNMTGGGPPGALSAPAASLGTALAAERREKAAEMVASFLSQVRATAGRETLLGAAASGGHLEAVQLLLSARADPGICDDHGCSALHRAAESGRLLAVLLVLDRLQATNRALCVAELTNLDGETPEMFAALAGASDVCRAFEVFGEMQNDAEERQLGCSTSTSDFAGGGYRGANAGSLLAFLDLAADSKSAAGSSASSLLLRSAAGNGLARDIFRRVPEDEEELSQLVDQVCHGIRAAEECLLSTTWNPTDQGLDPAARTFMRTAEVRSTWQKLRIDAVRSEGIEGLDDFWQTHVHAEMMVATLMNARGDTFQLLLTVLWLYTREAWLRHTIDTLAGALCAASGQTPGGNSNGNWAAAEGTTGGTTLCGPDVPSSMQPLEPLVQALAPLMQLVQSALAWFEEAGIRHTGMTYRPLSLPMLGLQRLIDRYIAARREGEGEDGRVSQEAASLISGAWVALGAGSFFSAISSRADAIKRMTRTRCNVLLVVRPDEQSACFPKQMSLRGNGVDDVLFPLGCVFRITRITRTVSSDLDPESCRGANVRWPVMIFELAAANKFLDVLELLERRGELGPGGLETRLQEWVDGACAGQQHERMFAAGELIMRCCSMNPAIASAATVHGNTGSVGAQQSRSRSRSEKAAAFLREAASAAEENDDAGGVANALLALARCNISAGVADPDQVTMHGRKAIALLTECNGANHPETCAARAAWRELGVPVKNPT